MDAGGRRRGDCGVRSGPLRQPRGGPRLGVPGGDVRAERRDAHGAGPDRARRGPGGRRLHGPRAASSRARGPVAGASVAGPRGHHVGAFRGRGAAAQRRAYRSEHPRTGGARVLHHRRRGGSPGGVPLCRAYDDRGPRGSGRRSSGRGLYGEGGRLAAHEGPEEPGADERAGPYLHVLAQGRTSCAAPGASRRTPTRTGRV